MAGLEPSEAGYQPRQHSSSPPCAGVPAKTIDSIASESPPSLELPELPNVPTRPATKANANVIPRHVRIQSSLVWCHRVSTLDPIMAAR